MLREVEAGAKTADLARKHGTIRGEAVAGAGGREQTAEALARGYHVGQRRSEGRAGKEW